MIIYFNEINDITKNQQQSLLYKKLLFKGIIEILKM